MIQVKKKRGKIGVQQGCGQNPQAFGRFGGLSYCLTS